MGFKRLAVQPQQGFTLDRGNPITRGLEFAWVGSEPKRMLSGGRASLNFSNIPSSTNQIGTVGLPSNGLGRSLQTNNNPAFMANEWTGLVFFIQPTIGTASALFQSTTGPGTNDRSFGIEPSGALNAYVYDGGVKSIDDGTALTAGKPYVACAANTGTSLQIWKNGALSASLATATGGFTGYGASGPFVIIGQAAVGGDGSTAEIALMAWWSRALSAVEHRALADNPWQILAVRSGVQAALMRSAFTPSAGAGVTARPQVFVCT